jgi:hypothetical protein
MAIVPMSMNLGCVYEEEIKMLEIRNNLTE